MISGVPFPALLLPDSVQASEGMTQNVKCKDPCRAQPAWKVLAYLYEFITERIRNIHLSLKRLLERG